MYNSPQEALRENAERLYAVWLSRWFSSKYPARYMNLRRIINTFKATAILHSNAVEHRSHGFIASKRMAAAAALRGAGPDDCHSQRTSRQGTAFVSDSKPACGGVWGAPAPVPDGKVNDGRGCECAPAVMARYMRVA